MQSKSESAALRCPVNTAASRSMLSMAAVCILSIVLTGCGDNTPPAQNATKPAEPQAQPKPDFADAATLRKRVVEHTFTGQMGPTVVTEFYASGGVIHGAGYRAQWRIDDNRLCVNYDDAPQDDCYDIRFEGQIMQWLRGGEIRGQGVLVAGNPNRL